MKQLTLDVWQFVRLMVGMEETLESYGGGKGSDLKVLYDRWEDIWVDLDARLVDLGRHDFEAFADLMMSQEVVLDDVSDAERAMVGRELEKVVARIKTQLAGTDDPGDVEDLSFERDELTLLIRDLRAGAV